MQQVLECFYFVCLALLVLPCLVCGLARLFCGVAEAIAWIFTP